MIESITFRNLLSIRGEQIISFAASKDDTKDKDNVVKMNGGTRLLRAAFLYSNNDTGKSNVTKLKENFVKLMTLAPTDRKEIEVKPFTFEAVNKNLASMVSITFYIEKEKYVLVAEFDNDKFHTEKLLYYHSRKPFKLLIRSYKKFSKDSDGSLYSGELVFER